MAAMVAEASTLDVSAVGIDHGAVFGANRDGPADVIEGAVAPSVGDIFAEEPQTPSPSVTAEEKGELVLNGDGQESVAPLSNSCDGQNGAEQPRVRLEDGGCATAGAAGTGGTDGGASVRPGGVLGASTALEPSSVEVAPGSSGDAVVDGSVNSDGDERIVAQVGAGGDIGGTPPAEALASSSSDATATGASACAGAASAAPVGDDQSDATPASGTAVAPKVTLAAISTGQSGDGVLSSPAPSCDDEKTTSAPGVVVASPAAIEPSPNYYDAAAIAAAAAGAAAAAAVADDNDDDDSVPSSFNTGFLLFSQSNAVMNQFDDDKNVTPRQTHIHAPAVPEVLSVSGDADASEGDGLVAGGGDVEPTASIGGSCRGDDGSGRLGGSEGGNNVMDLSGGSTISTAFGTAARRGELLHFAAENTSSTATAVVTTSVAGIGATLPHVEDNSVVSEGGGKVERVAVGAGGNSSAGGDDVTAVGATGAVECAEQDATVGQEAAEQGTVSQFSRLSCYRSVWSDCLFLRWDGGVGRCLRFSLYLPKMYMERI